MIHATIQLKQGSESTRRIELYESLKSKVPKNLTGWTGKAQLRRYAGEPNPIDVQVVIPTDGEFHVDVIVSDTLSAGLDPRSYECDVFVKPPIGGWQHIAQITYVILPSYTDLT